MCILTPITNKRILKNWTESAKYCFKIGCNCKNCIYAQELETIRGDTCRMKSVVLCLVREFGAPILAEET